MAETYQGVMGRGLKVGGLALSAAETAELLDLSNDELVERLEAMGCEYEITEG